MQKHSPDLSRFQGFWQFIYFTLAQDRFVLLAFLVYTVLLTLPFPILYNIMVSFSGFSKLVILGIFMILAVFFTNLVNRIFEMAVSFAVIERYRGRTPTLESVSTLLREKTTLILKITGLCFLFDLGQITLGGFLDLIFNESRPASKFFVSFFFSSVDIAKSIFVGFLIPISICSKESDLTSLSSKTFQLLNDHFLKSISFNIKLGFVGFVWVVALIAVIAVVPNYSGDSNLLKISLLFLFYSILPITHFISLCVILVYSRAVTLILDQQQTSAQVKNELIAMGANSKSFRSSF